MLLWKEFENNTTGDLRKILRAHHFNQFMNILVQFQSDEIGARTISFTESIVNAMLSSFILLVKVIFIWQGEQDLDQIPYCFALH